MLPEIIRHFLGSFLPKIEYAHRLTNIPTSNPSMLPRVAVSNIPKANKSMAMTYTYGL